MKTSLAKTAKEVARALLSGWGDFFWMVTGSVFFALLVVQIVVSAPGFATMAAQDQSRALLAASVGAAAAFLAIFVALWPRSAFYRDAKARSPGLALIACAVLLAVKWLLNRAYATDLALTGYSQSIVIVLLVCAFAPLVEESFFRGLAWVHLRRRGISEPGILGATTLLFVLSHLPPDLASLAQLLFMGGCLGLIRLFSGSIWAGIMCHGLMNAVVLFSV